MTQKLTGNDFDIASPVHGEINKNPWNKDEREQKTKFLPSLCFSGPEINNLPVKSAQSNIIIGSKELGLRPDGTNVQKLDADKDRSGGSRVIRAEKFVRGVFFFWIVWRESVSGTPNGNIPPKPRTVAWMFLELRQLFAQLHFELRPEEFAPNPDRKKIQRFGVMEMVMNLRMV